MAKSLCSFVIQPLTCLISLLVFACTQLRLTSCEAKPKMGEWLESCASMPWTKKKPGRTKWLFSPRWISAKKRRRGSSIFFPVISLLRCTTWSSSMEISISSLTLKSEALPMIFLKFGQLRQAFLLIPIPCRVRSLKKKINIFSSCFLSALFQVRQAVTQLLGDVVLTSLNVHIISSNTHSVLNCLSPWIHQNKEKILKWGKEAKPEIKGSNFSDQNDYLYVLTQFYLTFFFFSFFSSCLAILSLVLIQPTSNNRSFRAFPKEAEAREQLEKLQGILSIQEEGFTGITVQLISPKLLSKDHCDSNLNLDYGSENIDLLVNVDYAFGQQVKFSNTSLSFSFSDSPFFYWKLKQTSGM